MRLRLLLAALLLAATQAQAQARAAHGAATPERPHSHHHQAHRLLRDGATGIDAPAPAAAMATAAAAGAARIDACRQRCPSLYLPVCGAGGTYLNACWAACMGAEPFAVGECDAAADKFMRSMGSGCESRCATASTSPVCAENGFTFTSACVAKCSNLTITAGTCCACAAFILLMRVDAILRAYSVALRAGLRAASSAMAPPPLLNKSG